VLRAAATLAVFSALAALPVSVAFSSPIVIAYPFVGLITVVVVLLPTILIARRLRSRDVAWAFIAAAASIFVIVALQAVT
jgi:hypothetical protein